MNTNTVPRSGSADTPNEAWEVPARQTILVLTIAAGAMIALDIGGPIRSVVTLLVVLVAPGLAASMSMGTLSTESRVLISVVGSTVLVTVIATVMTVTGVWSPGAGFVMIALLTIGLTLFPIEPSGNRGERYSIRRSTKEHTGNVGDGRGGSEHRS